LVPGKFEWLPGNATELDDMTSNLYSKCGEELFSECAASDASGCLASGGAFEDVAEITYVVFQATWQIRVTGTWSL